MFHFFSIFVPEIVPNNVLNLIIMSKDFEARRIVCNQKAYDFMKNLAFVLSEATSKDFERYDFCYDLIHKGLIFIELLRSENVSIKDNL